MKLYHIQAEKEGGFTIIGGHFHRALLGLLLQAGILTCSWWGQDVATRAAWEEMGGLQGRKASRSPLHRPSVSVQFTACVLTDPLWSSSSPCHGSDCFCMERQEHTQPLPIHLFLPLTCVARYLPAVPSGKRSVVHTGYFHLAPGNCRFFLLIISPVLQPFVHSLIAWSVMRGRHSRARFNLKQHWVYINTVVKSFRPLAFAQNSSLYM